jgi:hypothetical protein
VVVLFFSGDSGSLEDGSGLGVGRNAWRVAADLCGERKIEVEGIAVIFPFVEVWVFGLDS